MSELYIGLMSGTSMDGIDAALVDFAETSAEILAVYEHEYPAGLREELESARADAGIRTADDVATLHRQVGECFRDAANALLDGAAVDAASVTAIGSHGQTIRHEPGLDEPFSLQIGEPDLIALGTGITTVADFRSADIALGGQGAPLAPAFHEWRFRRRGENRIVLNIGGIANITILRGDESDTTGFDTGPGNTLMDAWTSRHRGATFDRNGEWAASGSVNSDLLRRLLADPYFAAPAPKSTGFEYFNLEWLDAHGVAEHDPADVQATVCALTAESIAAAVREGTTGTSKILVCGGGVHSTELLRLLRERLPGIRIGSTAEAGLDPDWVEAVAFAWLAMRTIHSLPGNLPSVTGALRPAVLGTIHTPD